MRWRILALLFAARVGLGFQFQTMASVGGDLSDAFGLDNAEIGLMIGLFMAPGLFLALPAGFSGFTIPVAATGTVHQLKTLNTWGHSKDNANLKVDTSRSVLFHVRRCHHQHTIA